MPAAAQRNRDAWIGLDRVKEERGLKIGGWYAITMDAGSDSASSATRVVRLFDGYESEGGMYRLDHEQGKGAHSIVSKILFCVACCG